jgi:uncharacterized protein YbjT (DUF2867 family)
MTLQRTVLVTGSTGTQGGAVARALLAGGHKVVAFTRNPGSPPAAALAAAGARLAQGDFRWPETLARALGGVDTLYLMGTPYGTSPEDEAGEGIAAIDAARQVGVGHLIYSSVAGADTSTGIPHFESKYRVEQHLAASGISATVSAPVAFMDFINPIFIDGLRQGEFRMPLPASRPLQYVTPRDIGRFVAALAGRREQVFGRRIEIAGDERTGPETAAVLSRASGREIRYAPFPPSALKAANPDLAAMFEWLDHAGYAVDRAALAAEFPDVGWHTLEDWAGEQDWRAALGPIPTAARRGSA